MLLPFVRFLPPLYQWRVRSRIYRWYRNLLAINPEQQAGVSPENTRTICKHSTALKRKWRDSPGRWSMRINSIACANWHIGLALLVAANYRGPRTLELVAGYLFASAIVSIPYLRWRSKVLSESAYDP